MSRVTAKNENCSSMLNKDIIYILIERALFALAMVGFSPLPAFLNAWFLIFCFARGHPSRMDMELIMKLIFAGCVLRRVLRTNQVLFYTTVSGLLSVIAISSWMKYTKSIQVKSMASPSNLDEEQKKIGEEEKNKEEEDECQRDAWFLFVWRMRIRLVHWELQKLFSKAFPDKVHMRQETVLYRVIDSCEDTTNLILTDSKHRGVPSPVFGEALGCRTLDTGNAVGHEHAIDLQTMTIKAEGLEMLNKHLISEVESYRDSCVELHNNNQALEKKVQELEEENFKLRQEKLILCNLLKVACDLCKNYIHDFMF